MPQHPREATGACHRPCTGPEAPLFRTDHGRAHQWARAATLCDHCPALAACQNELAAAYPSWGPGRRRTNPAGVVWAGAIFSPHHHLWTRLALTRAVTTRVPDTRRRPGPTRPLLGAGPATSESAKPGLANLTRAARRGGELTAGCPR